MKRQRSGKIINIGSNFGVVAFSGRAVYAGAKAAVDHLSRALSLEWAKSGVTVNVVALPEHGLVNVQSGARVATYTPANGYVGADSFT